jgi:hypothetical protein
LVARVTGEVPAGRALFYQKHMTHHMLPHIDLDWLDTMVNVFLIREPARVLASYAERRAEVTLADLGLPQQQRLFDAVCQRRGAPPPVLDADDVLADPRGMLTALCDAVGVAFDPAMLSWPAGRRDSDGLWAEHWYASVERSTGFMAPPGRHRPIPKHLSHLVDAALPYYQVLLPHRLTADARP